MTDLPASLTGTPTQVPFADLPARTPGVFNYVANIEWQAQKANDWCWAACAVMISQALGVWRNVDGQFWTQCRVLALVHPAFSETLYSLTCPRDRLEGICDTASCADGNAQRTEGVVSNALRLMLPPTELAKVSNSVPDIPAAATIQEMIDRGQPLAVLGHMKTSTGRMRRHYVLIVGYDAPRNDYFVWDPAVGAGLRPVDLQNWWSEFGDWIGSIPLLP